MSTPAHSGQCPQWCEKPPGHPWEDVWTNGPVRVHTWTRTIGETGDEIRIEELEQQTPHGPTRRRHIVLDVEAPTQWDIAAAEHALRLLTDAISVARPRSPENPDTVR